MNILFSNRCNRNCPYCFARERVALEEASRNDSPAFLSRDDFDTVLDFTVRSKQKTIGVLGGEPSLHPEFPAMLKAAWARGIQTKIFTNGSWRPEHIDEIERELPAPGERRRFDLLHIVLNVNEPDRTPPKEKAYQQRILERLGRYCGMSFNVSHIGFKPGFLIDVILKYKTERQIRLGLAQPLAEMPNEYIDVGDYGKAAPAIVDLAKRCDAHDVRLGFDCGFTMCMFTPEQLGELVMSGARVRASCGPAIDIGTDLTVWACFPLSVVAPRLRLLDFDDIRQLTQALRRPYERLYRVGALDECIRCKLRTRGQCAGGCAAHVYRRLSP